MMAPACLMQFLPHVCECSVTSLGCNEMVSHLKQPRGLRSIVFAGKQQFSCLNFVSFWEVLRDVMQRRPLP